MNVYLLRHEKRPIDNSTYFVSLTDEGLLNSIKLVDRINEIQIDEIYCSPFLRTIQTILPYCKKYNRKIKIEYSLYEYIDPHVFNSYTFKHTHDELYGNFDEISKYIDETYTSFLSVDALNYEESIKGCVSRVCPFIDNLYTKSNNKQNILLISHGTPLAIIKKFVEKKMEYTLTDEKIANYPDMGELYKLQ
tara:strand:- start:148 stop:723 length:576 start_codon:yes stop_codon:yes gene_type:complete